MPQKAVVVPPLGHRWVDSRSRGRVWGRRLTKHSGTQVIYIPVEVRRDLNWENGDILLLQIVGDELHIHRPAVRELQQQGEKK